LIILAFFLGISRFRRLYLTAMVLFLLVTACGRAAAERSNAPSSTCGLSDQEAAGLNGDPVTDVNAISHYKKAISELLMAQKFKELDCLADSARSSKATFSGGRWVVHTIYLALEKPEVHPTEKDWKTHLGRLEHWAGKNPDSITARVALAEAYLDYGWSARGQGNSDTVSKTGWSFFDKRADHAKKILDEASSLSTKCPEWYAAMQKVALSQDWNPSQKWALLQKAVAFEPGYYYYYLYYANSRLPQWGGAEGEVEEFLQNAADQVGGSAGDVLYFHVADWLLCCQDEPLKLSWPRIVRGFDALERLNGKSLLNCNIMALMATKSSDVATTSRMLTRIGDQWSDEVWQTHGYFEQVKQWAKQVIPYINAKTPMEEAADANLLTVEGKTYTEMVFGTIRNWIPDCEKASSGGVSSAGFKFLIKIGKDGLVDQLVTVGSSAVGNCVSGKAVSRSHSYPPPPHPDYWVAFELSPEEASGGTK
jgi:hypothetical protein